MLSDYPTVSYRRLTKTSVAPKKAHKTDAAFDLYSDERIDITPGGSALVGTGIALDMSKGLTGHYAAILSRSGMAAKNRIFVLNAPGLIDTGYRGEIKIILQNLGSSVYHIDQAERIAQIMFLPNYVVYLNEVNELSESDRGEEGFGSSGKK
jgi:dUTP pyrophosphatase